MSFSDEQVERYSRQIILREVGGAGQRKLLAARALIIGAGGLGSPAALYLAAAGVGVIGIVDSDRVELSNLQRQVLHTTGDIGRPKAESAAAGLQSLNPDCSIEPHFLRLTAENISELIGRYDLVIDGSDNFPTRYLVNDACVMAGKPLFFAGILGFDGQALTIVPGESACLRCVFPEPPPPGLVPSCQEAGVLGTVAGLLGVVQANEALKFLLGTGELLTDRLLIVDAWSSRFHELMVERSPACPVCGERPEITSLEDEEYYCT